MEINLQVPQEQKISRLAEEPSTTQGRSCSMELVIRLLLDGQVEDQLLHGSGF